MHFPKTQRCCPADVKKVRTLLLLCGEEHKLTNYTNVSLKGMSFIAGVFKHFLSYCKRVFVCFKLLFPVSVTFMEIRFVLAVYLLYHTV